VGSRDASGLDPVLDISAMELDQLLRLGIAEAQLATVARVRRDRVLHIHTARSYLMAALKKNGGSDPDLRAHLLAVLLKLGMESRAMQGITFEGGGAAAVGGQAQHNTPAKGPTASSDNTSSTSTPEEVIVRSDSDHSSKDADESVLRVCRFDAMKEHLLSDDSQVESFSVTSPKLAGLTHPDALLGESSEEGSFNASLATERREVTKCLRTEPLSIVDEHEHPSEWNSFSKKCERSGAVFNDKLFGATSGMVNRTRLQEGCEAADAPGACAMVAGCVEISCVGCVAAPSSSRARDILNKSRQCGRLSQASCSDDADCEWHSSDGGKCDLTAARLTQLCSVLAAAKPRGSEGGNSSGTSGTGVTLSWRFYSELDSTRRGVSGGGVAAAIAALILVAGTPASLLAQVD